MPFSRYLALHNGWTQKNERTWTCSISLTLSRQLLENLHSQILSYFRYTGQMSVPPLIFMSIIADYIKQTVINVYSVIVKKNISNVVNLKNGQLFLHFRRRRRANVSSKKKKLVRFCTHISLTLVGVKAGRIHIIKVIKSNYCYHFSAPPPHRLFKTTKKHECHFKIYWHVVKDFRGYHLVWCNFHDTNFVFIC